MLNDSAANPGPSVARHFSSAQNIPMRTAGIVDGQYVWRGEDNSRAFIFFCGAVPPHNLVLAPIYQRWKWLTKINNPVVIAQDPFVNIQTGLELAWYIGPKQGPRFSETLAPALHIAQGLTQGEVCGMGSSGGGFAALMAAVHNYVDSTLAINPQVNVLRYTPGMARKFLRFYGADRSELQRDDLDRLSVADSLWRYADAGRIHVVINAADKLHYHKHVLPLCQAVRDGRYEGFTFSRYTNVERGHNPPIQQQTLWLMQKWWPKSIVATERKHLMGLNSLEPLTLD